MPSVEIVGFQGFALLAQSRVLARLIPEPGTMVSSSACLLIMLTRFVIRDSAPVNAPTSVEAKQNILHKLTSRSTVNIYEYTYCSD